MLQGWLVVVWSYETIKIGQGYLLGLSGLISAIPPSQLIISRADNKSI